MRLAISVKLGISFLTLGYVPVFVIKLSTIEPDNGLSRTAPGCFGTLFATTLVMEQWQIIDHLNQSSIGIGGTLATAITGGATK
jgi:hypothetical protein